MNSLRRSDTSSNWKPICPGRSRQFHSAGSPKDEGFLLLGAIVAIALVLIALAIAAPRVARDLRREREVEAVHRANQYVRAIQLYYRKFGHYPGSIGQLENSNNIRFLRQRYTDPITGKADFRTIPVGQNKTTVKTFFGQPLGGLAAGGIGSVAAMASPGMGGSNLIGAAGAASGGIAGTNSGLGSSSGNAAAATSDQAGLSPATGASGPGPSGATGSTGSGSPSVFSGTAQPFMGVGLDTKGDSILEPNEQTTYDTWEFLYDPRLDQLKAKAAALNGGSIGSVPSNSLGQANPAFGASSAPGTSSSTTPPSSGSPGTSSTSGAPPATQP